MSCDNVRIKQLPNEAALNVPPRSHLYSTFLFICSFRKPTSCVLACSTGIAPNEFAPCARTWKRPRRTDGNAVAPSVAAQPQGSYYGLPSNVNLRKAHWW
mmetsp:Transcript_12040/g.31001  ORF Transcript_12040/g.31001 Transcript_12040/m.31001 type:complete len:100 (-) Transcript_12040:1996-2295(-)